MIITIDGPSGTGKSSVAHKIAELLGFTYVDTGAMFRAFAYGILKRHLTIADTDAIISYVRTTPLQLIGDALHKRCILGDEDVTDFLRDSVVAQMASQISTLAEVRAVLLSLQRSFAKEHHAIFCGRDMGTVVFPNADLKIYLTADSHTRAKRRHKEITHTQPNLSLTTIQKEIEQRDDRDQNRAIAPLKPASDAHIIDTSHMTLDEVIDAVLGLSWECGS